MPVFESDPPLALAPAFFRSDRSRVMLSATLGNNRVSLVQK